MLSFVLLAVFVRDERNITLRFPVTLSQSISNPLDAQHLEKDMIILEMARAGERGAWSTHSGGGAGVSVFEGQAKRKT